MSHHERNFDKSRPTEITELPEWMNLSDQQKLIIFGTIQPSSQQLMDYIVETIQQDRADFTYTFDESNPDTTHTNLLYVLSQECIYKPEEHVENQPHIRKDFTGTESGETLRMELGHEPAFSFTLQPQKASPYYFNSEYQNDGTVAIMTQLVSKDRSGNLKRSSIMPRLSELIGLMLEYYNSRELDIHGIHGQWYRVTGVGENEIENTNFSIFSQHIQQGMTPEKAASLTPTGKSVAKFGFTDVEVYENFTEGACALFTKPDLSI